MSRRKRKPTGAGMPPAEQAFLANQMAYNVWYEYLYGLLLSSIIWENLPPGIPENFVEIVLNNQGYILFFMDEVLDGYVMLPCQIGGELNVYNIPIYREVHAPNGYHVSRTMKDSVVIFNNYMHTPSMMTIDYYARKLAMLDRAMDVNMNNQKFPFIIKCNREQELTMKNLYNQYEGNVPAMFVSDDFNVENIEVLNTGAPYVGDKMEITKHSIFNDFLTWLGVENSNQDKKERLVSSEVASNYGNVEMSRNMRLNSRAQGAREVYELFGWEMYPRFNSNLATLINMGEEMIEQGEQVYNRSKMDSGTDDSELYRKLGKET